MKTTSTVSPPQSLALGLPAHWSLRQEVDQEKVHALRKALNLQPLTAHMLVSRGFDSPEQAHPFLQPSLHDLPDPKQMKGMEQACKRIIKAIQEKERIVIYGDYDVDGVSATSLLFLFLRELGVPQERLFTFIPHRLEHGYGLQSACFPDIAKMKCDLMITVDCGISSRDEIDELNQIGMDVIVIDHHIPPEQLPDAYTILNPRQPSCSYPDKNLAAVGVAYQLVIHLRAALRESGFFNEKQPNLLRYIDIVALGTVADIVPLQGVNRILVHYGLRQLAQTEWPGLRALMEVSKVDNKRLDASSIGFRLGPRINAAGRLDHASLGVQLLTSSNPNEAMKCARQMDQINSTRKQLQESIYNQAQQLFADDSQLQQEHAIVLARAEWHLGVVGIVASKLLEQWSRPVILLALDQTKGVGKGSARSIPSFDIYQAIASCQTYLQNFGGHKAAAGLTVPFEHLDDFKEAFLQYARENIMREAMQPTVSYDAEFDPGNFTFRLLEEIQQLAPFGAQNPQPLMIARGVNVSNQRVTRDGQHLQFKCNRLSSIAYRQAQKYPLAPHVTIAYHPQFNHWNGQTSIQLHVREIH